MIDEYLFKSHAKYGRSFVILYKLKTLVWRIGNIVAPSAYQLRSGVAVPRGIRYHDPMSARPTQPVHRPSFDNGLKSQLRVLSALVLRELHSRYGRENLGFLWVIGEPMLFASVITLIHLNEPTHYSNDIEPAPFAIVGYTLFIIFRNTFNRADGAIESNQPLLYHRAVSIFDILFSRVTMEMLGCFATTAILMLIAIMFGYASPPVRPLYLITAALMMGWWTLGLTLIAATVTYRNELFARQLHVISYFSIPISCAFFQLSWAPAAIRDKLQWFPMALIFEQARYGQFRSAPDTYVDPPYVVAWCAVLLFLGLLMTRRARSKVYG